MEAPKAHLAVAFAIALAAMATTALVAGLLPALQRIQSTGNVKSLGIAVYKDRDCTYNLTDINWELVEAGKNYTRTIWIKNTGNTRVILNMTTESWDPPKAKNHITLTWNRERSILSAGQSINATLTLTVLASVVQTDIVRFSFTIVITGTEYS